jgi:four helix bundle protein
MIIRRYQDLDTWQLTEEFKRLVHALVKGSDQASRNLRHRDQIFNSSGGPSKHVSEGFARFNAKEFCRFLDYAFSSVAETENHLRDGIDWGYYRAEACEPIFHMARRCSKAILGLKHSQKRYIAAQEERRRVDREEKRQRQQRRPKA